MRRRPLPQRDDSAAVLVVKGALAFVVLVVVLEALALATGAR